ncbi:hypothetical protein D3C75_1230350 [compost metagenome]
MELHGVEHVVLGERRPIQVERDAIAGGQVGELFLEVGKQAGFPDHVPQDGRVV